MIRATEDAPARAAMEKKVSDISGLYAEMSDMYQANKGSAGIPLD
jgi:hypothetical protein